MTPFLKVCHRNGAVFLRLVHTGVLGLRETQMLRLTPAQARELGQELARLAEAAATKHVRQRTRTPK